MSLSKDRNQTTTDDNTTNCHPLRHPKLIPQTEDRYSPSVSFIVPKRPDKNNTSHCDPFLGTSIDNGMSIDPYESFGPIGPVPSTPAPPPPRQSPKIVLHTSS